MPIDIFGFSIGRRKPTDPVLPVSPDQELSTQKSFVEPDSYDGTYTLDAGGVFGTLYDFTGSVREENQLIAQFRNMSLFPEVDQAIEDIVNESIVMDNDKKPIKLDLQNTDISDNIKNKIYKEYDYVLRLLNFHNKAYDIYRRWYIDSKLYFHIMIDSEVPQKGIQEIRAIDPVKIKKIRKVQKEPAHIGTNKVPFIKKIEEFYVYTDTDKNSLYPTKSTDDGRGGSINRASLPPGRTKETF